jgi:hypothetical protein
MGKTTFDGDELRNDFPGWNIWRSDVGAWYANRDHVLTGAEMYAGLYPTVAADTPGELRAALEKQRRTEAKIEEAKRKSREWSDPSPALNPAYL